MENTQFVSMVYRKHNLYQWFINYVFLVWKSRWLDTYTDYSTTAGFKLCA